MSVRVFRMYTNRTYIRVVGHAVTLGTEVPLCIRSDRQLWNVLSKLVAREGPIEQAIPVFRISAPELAVATPQRRQRGLTTAACDFASASAAPR